MPLDIEKFTNKQKNAEPNAVPRLKIYLNPPLVDKIHLNFIWDDAGLMALGQ